MKKTIFNKFLLTAVIAIGFTSCLKDKGYEDGLYGAVRNTAGQELLSIPVAAKNPNVLGIESKAGAQNIEMFVASYDYVNAAASDISGTLVLNNALVTAADPTAIVLPSNLYTIPSMNITVKSGQRVSDKFIISLNTSTLDPTKKYGIAFTLTSVSKGGVAIPSNLKDVVYLFTVKNKYDGIYTAKFRMEPGPIRIAAGQGSFAGPYTYGFDIHMITTGPTSVRMFNTAFNAGFHPLMTPAASGFGSTEASFVFDANDKMVSVSNLTVGARTFRLNPAVTTSRYDPATKTIYAAIIMDQAGFDPLPIFDTLIFKAKRP